MAFERLRAQLELDTSGFRSGVQDAQRDMDSLSDRAQGMGKSMQKVGAGLSLGVTAPLAAMGGKALGAAADAEELGDRSEAIFGEMTGDVQQWAEATAEEMGRSRRQMLDHASTMQDMIDPTGEATEETMDLSMGMAELAQDVGSFQNMDADRVMEKFMSAMAGQSRAVRDLGVDMSAAAVEAELLEMGIEGGAEAASDAEEAQARYNILMRETQAAHGDAIRTQDTFTGATRQLRGQVANLAEEFGQHLIPTATVLAQAVNDLISGFDGLSTTQQQVIVAFAAFAAAIGPVLLGVGTLLTLLPTLVAGLGAVTTALAVLTGPIGLVAVAIAALAVAWQQDFMGIQTRTLEAVNAIMRYLDPLIRLLRHEFIQTLRVWQAGIQAVLARVQALWNQHGDQVMAIVGPFLTALETAFDVTFGALFAIVDTGFRNMVELISAMFSLMRGDTEGFKESMVNIFWNLAELAIAPFEWLYERLIGNSIIPNMLSDIRSAVSDFDLSGAFEGALDGALSTVRGYADDFRSAGEALGSTLAEGMSNARDSVEGAASGVADRARGAFNSSDAEYGPLSDTMEAGKALPETLAKGMEANAGAVNGPAGEVAGNAKPRVGQTGSGSGASGLDGMAIELMGTLDVSGDVATLDDVDARLRRVKRQADNRGVRR